MKTTTFSLVAFLLLILFGCKEDTLSDDNSAAKRTVSLRVKLELPSVVDTKAVDESALSDLHVLIYKDGNLYSKQYITSVTAGTTIPDIAVPEHPYNVYAIANTGIATRFDACVTEAQLLEEQQTMNLLSETTPNDRIIMCGNITVPDYPGEVTIPLQRIAAKLLITVNNNTSALSLMGMRLGNIANRSYIISRGSSDAANSSSAYYSSDAIAINSGEQQTFYVFENQKGTGVNKTTSKAAPTGAAYLEFLAKKLDTGDRYLYRIYLGENATTDYNIKRNYEYTVTVNLNGVTQIATDIRVTKYTTLGYVESGLLMHYDGIWNNGVGVHITNSSTSTRGKWVNLGYGGSDYDLTLTNFAYTSSDGWNSDYLAFPSSRTRYASSIILKSTDRPATGTLEVVFRSNSSSQGQGYTLASIFCSDLLQPYSVFAAEYYYKGLGFVAATNWNGQDYTNSNIQTNKYNTAVEFDGNKCIGFYNGNQVSQEVKAYPSLQYNLFSNLIVGNNSMLGGGTKGFSGRIYSVRFYTRALTAAEIQANYQVDKVRFGL